MQQVSRDRNARAASSASRRAVACAAVHDLAGAARELRAAARYYRIAKDRRNLLGTWTAIAHLECARGRHDEASQALERARPYLHEDDAPEFLVARFWAVAALIAEKTAQPAAVASALVSVPPTSVEAVLELAGLPQAMVAEALQAAPEPGTPEAIAQTRAALEAATDPEQRSLRGVMLAAQLAAAERYPEAAAQARAARQDAVAHRAVHAYVMASSLLASVEVQLGDRVAAYGTALRGAVSVVDLMGAGADAPFREMLRLWRESWGEEAYLETAETFIRIRKQEQAAAAAG